MFALLLVATLSLASTPDTPTSIAPTPDARPIELALPQPLENLRTAHRERLRQLQEEFATNRDAHRALALQKEIRNEKLRFEVGVLRYQLTRVEQTQKTATAHRLRETIESLEDLIKGELEPAPANTNGSDQ